MHICMYFFSNVSFNVTQCTFSLDQSYVLSSGAAERGAIHASTLTAGGGPQGLWQQACGGHGGGECTATLHCGAQGSQVGS